MKHSGVFFFYWELRGVISNEKIDVLNYKIDRYEQLTIERGEVQTWH